MDHAKFINPKKIEVEGKGGVKKTFIISELPFYSDGEELLIGSREFCSQYIASGAPKIGDYRVNEELSKKMFGFVAVVLADGTKISLETPQLVNNHVDFLMGVKLEAAMLEHNLGFSVAEKISGFLDKLTAIFDQSASKISTALREQSLAQEKPHSTSSEPSTQ